MDKVKKRNFVGVKCFYIDDEFLLKSINPGVIEIRGRKSNDLIRKITEQLIYNIFLKNAL